MTVPVDADRLRRRFEALGEIGATLDGRVNRPALSGANRAARDHLVEWFEDQASP